MAKKKIDLWGDINQYKANEVSTPADSSLLLGGKKSKKNNGPIINEQPAASEGVPSRPQTDNRKLKNPLSIVEGRNEVETDVSTAVSAALAKAIQDDYEIDELGKILDVVIDEVDDPDLSNESLRRKNFGIIPLFLVIGSIILSIILIPLVLMLGFSIGKVSSLNSARELMGYKTDIDGTDEETHFAIQHLDTGKYLAPPVDEFGVISYNEPITLTDTSPFTVEGDLINDLYFHVPTADTDQIQINFDTFSIVNDGGEVKWMQSFEAQSGIYLVRSNSGEQKFSIGFENTDKFLAYDAKHDVLELSNNPDYFKFEADVSFIKDSDSYLSDYVFTNAGTDGYVSNLDLGINGNALSLYSTKSKLYLNSYKTVDYRDLPFIQIQDNGLEYKNSLKTSREQQYNFFLNPVNTASEQNLTLGAFQTTKFDWTQIPWGTKDDGGDGSTRAAIQFEENKTTQYPLLTGGSFEQYEAVTKDPSDPIEDDANEDELFLGQYTHAYQKGKTMNDGTVLTENLNVYSDTIIYLLPDPTNLKNKAIYFVEADAFLSTEGGVHLQQISDKSQIDDLDFFTFKYSKKRNPENITSIVDSIKDTTADFTIYSNNYASLKGFELFLHGFSSEMMYRLKQDLSVVFNDTTLSTDEKKAAIKQLINDDRTDFVHQKSATANSVNTYKLEKLDFNTWYIGIANVYRDQDKNTGSHSTSIPVIFKTADGNGNVNNWGDGSTIDIEEPTAGNPTSDITTTTPATVHTLRETTSVLNPDSMNNFDTDESKTDLNVEDMRTKGSTSLEVTTELENGSITKGESGVVTGIRVTLFDSEGAEVDSQEYTTTDKIWGLQDGDYTFLFTDLEPESTYTAQVEVSDIENAWFTPEMPDDNIPQGPITMDTERLIPLYFEDPIDTKYDNYGTGIYTELNQLTDISATDSINFKFTSVTDGSRFETGFKPLSSYLSDSGVSAGGKLTVKFKAFELAGGYGISIGGGTSMIGEEFTFEAILQMSPMDFDDWSKDSPIWFDGTSGQLKLFDGTVKHNNA